MHQHTLRDHLNDALKSAIDEQEECAIAVIRLVHTALKERDERARNEGRPTGLTDDEVIAMLEGMVEQHQDSMRRYEESGQLQLAEREREEINVIQRFLPAKMDDDSFSLAIDEVIADLGASKLKDIGRVMTELKSRYPGQMNFAQARRRICAQLD